MSNRAATSTPCVGSSARMTLTSPRRKGDVQGTFLSYEPGDCTGCSTDAVGCGGVARGMDRPPLPAAAADPDPAQASEDLDRRVPQDAEDAEERLSPARRRSSSTTPARSASSGDRGLEHTTTASRALRLHARRRRVRGGTAPDRFPPLPRCRRSSPIAYVQVDRPRPVRPVSPETERTIWGSARLRRGAPGTRAGAEARSSAQRDGIQLAQRRTSPGRRRRAGR